MISSRSPVRAQVLALLATSLLAIPYVAAESTERGLAARAPTPDRPRRFSTFVAENDLACCPAGSTEKYSGSCCATGLTCVTSNSTGQATCVTISTPTNGTNHTGNHTTETPSSTETNSGAMSVAAWGMWTSVVGLAAVVGVMSL